MNEENGIYDLEADMWAAQYKVQDLQGALDLAKRRHAEGMRSLISSRSWAEKTKSEGDWSWVFYHQDQAEELALNALNLEGQLSAAVDQKIAAELAWAEAIGAREPVLVVEPNICPVCGQELTFVVCPYCGD